MLENSVIIYWKKYVNINIHKDNMSPSIKEKSVRAALKLNIQKTKIMASGPITSWQKDVETMETVTDFIFLDSKNHCRW